MTCKRSLMAPALPLLRGLCLLLIASAVCGKVVYEEGYTVSTVVDGNKVNVNPHSVLPLFGSSSDLIVLDSTDSSFYTLSLSKENAIKPLAGSGAGYIDGDVAASRFEKPKSFAVDLSGNIYVADRGNLAIRKISKSGVSTIAGGYSTIPGHMDGPGRNATFSSDFELAFVPERCALMICDHGHKLIRQINLKPQDCAKGSQTVGVAAWAWGLAIGVSCLVGLVLGFAIRPYITSYEIPNRLQFNVTWKHYLISLGTLVQMLYFVSKNAIVSSNMYTSFRTFILLILSHLGLMFSINNNTVKKAPSLHQKSLSLLDSDVFGSEDKIKFNIYDEQMRSLITFEGDFEFQGPNEEIDRGENKIVDFDISSNGNRRIDNMIEANIFKFDEKVEEVDFEELSISSLGLVKRR